MQAERAASVGAMRLCLRRQEAQTLLRTAAPKLLVKQFVNKEPEKGKARNSRMKKKTLSTDRVTCGPARFAAPLPPIIYLWEALVVFSSVNSSSKRGARIHYVNEAFIVSRRKSGAGRPRRASSSSSSSSTSPSSI